MSLQSSSRRRGLRELLNYVGKKGGLSSTFNTTYAF